MSDTTAFEPLLALVVALFLIWPVLGQLALYLFDRLRERRGKAALIPPADAPGDILARMYLWPVVLYRYRRAARTLDRGNPDTPGESR